MTTQARYAELLRTISNAKEISRRSVANQAGLHHNTVIRILDKGGDAGIDVMMNIGRAVGADPIRALIAVLVMEDPEAYFSPAVRVTAELITALTKQLHEIDGQLFEGFINQEFTSLISMLMKTMLQALERRDRRMNFI